MQAVKYFDKHTVDAERTTFAGLNRPSMADDDGRLWVAPSYSSTTPRCGPAFVGHLQHAKAIQAKLGK